MHRIYLLPGFGADKRLFNVFRPDGAEVHCMDWILPHAEESLAAYAARLAGEIDTSVPFSIAGVSLGGMVALELSRLVPAQKIFLISSIKRHTEMPWYYRLMGKMGLHKLFPPSFLRKNAFLIRPFFGRMNKKQYEVYKDMLLHTSEVFLRWGVSAILKWRNTEVPANLVHIHGTGDVVFPARYIRNYIPVKGGSHYMIVTRAREVGRIVSSHLSQPVA